MQVLDKGLIGLIEHMGSDRRIAQAAWVSYGKQEVERTDEEVRKLIGFLSKHKHGTPFEHVVFTFYIKCPIFVAREWMRHRIGSFNEISGRYVTFEAEFYEPEKLRVKGTTNKQGSVIPDEAWFEEHGYPEGFFQKVSGAQLTEAYEIAYNNYQTLLQNGVANEHARMVLPVGVYTQFYWTVNLRSLFNFVNLRSAEDAQWEIRQYSQALEEILKEQVPFAYETWNENGRIAP